ncbi:NADPH-dependent diflavin oxidoreductase 1 [Epargyreus clarus]|uniref:NADPH-dependent diflavin oxidoreductase 1 n=1 Tax=Epargyreus clarus TaxID=520877 RepID=UPI003C2F4394
MSTSKRVLILYGSQTFTAQEIAERIWRSTKILGFSGPVLAMDDYPIVELRNEEFVVFVCATTGQGEVPDNMKKFWRFLLRRNLPGNCLSKLRFGVLALGDSSYSKFNFAGKMLHKRLLQLGAEPLVNVGLCDYQHDLGHDAVAIPWLKEYFDNLKPFFPNIQTEDLKTDFVPRWKVAIIKDNEVIENCSNKDIYYETGWKDPFVNAVRLELEKNERTTDESHFQDVRLMTFKTISEEKIDYSPGDIFNIRPRNSKEDIENLFSIFKTHGIDIKPHYKLKVEKHYDDMPVPNFLKEPITMYEIAEQYWDLKAYPTQYFFSLLALVSEDKLEREKCIELSSPSGQEDWLNYSRRPKRTALEVLHDFHRTASKLTIEILFELFSTVKPRSFSIASSALVSHNTKIDILMAVVKYNTNIKKPRLGLASNWLKDLTPGDRVYGWIKKGSFKFAEEHIPQIMIGPGTGLAPFRSLLQERKNRGTADKQTLHLFFGCRYQDKDFHCRRELETMVDDGHLTLYCAFSRDQDRKIYVQHKISEHREELWKMVKNNAHIFISGNAKNMPDNVKDAFIEDVFCKTGGLSIEASKALLEDLEKSNRYQAETW